MANRIVSVHAGIYGMGIYAIMLPSSGFSVAHWSQETSYFSLLQFFRIKSHLTLEVPYVEHSNASQFSVIIDTVI